MHRMAPVHKTEKPTLAPLSLNSFWKYGLAAARSTLWHLTVWPVAQVRLTSTRLEWSCKRVNTALKCGLCPFHARVVNPLVDRSMISTPSPTCSSSDSQKISVTRLPQPAAGPQLTSAHHLCSSSPSQARRDCCARRRPAD